MITLSNAYQYIGRTNGVKAYGYNFEYYILLYAKATPDRSTGKHRVSIKMRLAGTANSTFYKWNTDGSVAVDGLSVFAWSKQHNPASAWDNSPSLTEGGVTYKHYVDLKEGSVDIDTAYAEKEVVISASWQRLAISSTPPKWLPSTTKATASISVLLPRMANPEPTEPVEPVKVSYSGIRIYADDVLAYDSRLEDYDLDGLKITKGLNVGGTAEIILPHEHPAYNYFVGHKTIVTIYRGNVLRFRGRALYAEDTSYGQRTIICEGEMCFLRDSINRPYNYQASPRSCFVTLINQHNSQTDPEKRFTVGSVTVTDPNDYIKVESESAETSLDTLDKLLERCGGYIKFTNGDDGSRVIHWLESLGQRSGQSIEFGENLLDFSSTGANTTNLATGIVPYGAKDEKTEKPITIASVNGGKDYILAEDAVAVRGIIMTTQTWDDVTEPANLLKKAQAYLEANKVFITSLELTALDLSYFDKDLDTFCVGDMVRVTSAPHGVNEDFQLSQMTEDLLNPANSQIVLGKDIQSLTGVEAVRVQSGKSPNLTGYVHQEDLGGYAKQEDLVGYVKQDDLGDYLTPDDLTGYATTAALNAEVNARAGVINKVSGVVNISGGAPVKILGGKVEIDGTEIHLGKEARFLNNSGIRIADKDGNSYYVLRVDTANSCVVGNDYCNLYLRGKDGVYLYKTSAAVTSDRREKNGVEELPEAYEHMLDKLTPVRFKYNGKGDTYHVGFVAQDVDAALIAAGLERADFGGFVDMSGDGTNFGLAYDEFIGLLLQKIRRLEKRIEALEE